MNMQEIATNAHRRRPATSREHADRRPPPAFEASNAWISYITTAMPIRDNLPSHRCAMAFALICVTVKMTGRRSGDVSLRGTIRIRRYDSIAHTTTRAKNSLLSNVHARTARPTLDGTDQPGASRHAFAGRQHHIRPERAVAELTGEDIRPAAESEN